MTEPGRIRISDDDRERYANHLRSAYAEGRITDAELEERLQTVFRARFETEAEIVIADLPVPVEPATTLAPSQRARESSISRVVRTAVQWYFPALICTGIWAITSFGGYFWPIWVFFGLTIPFLSSLVFDGDAGSETSPEIDGHSRFNQEDRRDRGGS